MVSADTMDDFGRDLRKKYLNESNPSKNQTVESKLDDIKNVLVKIDKSLEYLSKTTKKNSETKRFDTGLQTIPVAVTTKPDPDNTTTGGYTKLNIHDIIERNAPVIYFLNQGPGPIYALRSESINSFSESEIPIYPGEKKELFNIFELRFRTTIANTSYIITEHPTELILQNFDDRTVTPQHIFGWADVGPIGYTVLNMYTVPTGYKAKVHGVYATASITAPAFTPGFREIQIGITSPTIGGAAVFPIVTATIGPNHNAYGYTVEQSLGYAYTLLTSESIEIDILADTSIIGQVFYFGSIEITQYFSFPT